MEKIKVLLIDDHHTLMVGTETVLSIASQIMVVGDVNFQTVDQKLITEKAPDLVIVHFNGNEKQVLELIKLFTKEMPVLPVVLLSTHDDFNSISAMLKAGVKGYLLKNVKKTELQRAISKVKHGETYIQSAIAGKFINGYQKENHVTAINNLSPREIEVIRLIAKEYTSADIGKMLFISEHTVETHRKNIWRKTGVKSIVGLLNFAHEHQLI